MTRTIATTIRNAAAAAIIGLIAGAPAHAASLQVQMACAADYFAYCSQHPSEGPAVRQCMRDNGLKLSSRCVNALVSAGEVSKAEVARRAASAK